MSEEDKIEAVANSVRHVSGKEKPPKEGVIVLTVVRNGEAYMSEFLRHYSSLGVSHFVFLDNGSADDTVEMAAKRGDVSIWQTDLPFGRFDSAMRDWLLKTFGLHRWVLQVDIDEFFDFPLSHDLTICQLTRYLEQMNCGALRCLMLDMFPKNGIANSSDDKVSFGESHKFVNIKSIETMAGDEHKPQHLRRYFGGIRRKYFGGDDVFFLTKHPLVYFRESTIHTHHKTGEQIADVTGVLCHYKFAGNFKEYVNDCVNRNAHWNDSIEYHAYQNVLSERGDICLYDEDSIEYEGPESLSNHNLVSCPASFRIWVDEHALSKPDSESGASMFAKVFSECVVALLLLRRLFESLLPKADYVFFPSVRSYVFGFWKWFEQTKVSLRKERPRTDCCTAIILNYKRPHNIRAIVRSLLAADRVGDIHVVNNNSSHAMSMYFSSDHPRVHVIDNHRNGGALERYLFAKRIKGRFFLSIDDDTFLTAEQINALCQKLIEHPEVPHGLYGQFVKEDVSSEEGRFRNGVECLEGPMDILNRVYAFTAGHVDRLFSILEDIGMNDPKSWKKLSIADDIVISFCGTSKPLAHDLGRILACPTSDARGIAQWRQPEFDAFRFDLYKRLQNSVQQ